MSPPPWQEHPDDTKVIGRNVAFIDLQIEARKGSREPFALDLPLAWHTQLHVGCTHVPVPQYVGNYRGTPQPYINFCPVMFGSFTGAPATQVATELAAFETSLQRELERLDAAMPEELAATPSRLNLALQVVAVYYATWLRIHPFADGNGRTARLLANWIMARYWQPLIFPGRPPIDRDVLLAATTSAIASHDHRALIRHMRKRLTTARAGQHGTTRH